MFWVQLHKLISCIQQYNHEQYRALFQRSTINRHFSLQLLESNYEIYLSRNSMNWRFDCFGIVVANHEFVAFYQQFGDKSYMLQVTLESTAHWMRCVSCFPFLVVMSVVLICSRSLELLWAEINYSLKTSNHTIYCKIHIMYIIR